MKHIYVCVTSDVVTDQRILRHCNFLTSNGYHVHIVARKTKKSLPASELGFQVTRFNMLFESGPLFYLFFNLRLFFFLLFRRRGIVWANDLDTVTPCYFIKKIKKVDLVFDAHELFTEVPELAKSPLKKKIWLWVERKFASKADVFITVNQSLADQFNVRYAITPIVVRNVPIKLPLLKPITREELDIPKDVLICVLQGSGLNHGRGLLETIEAFTMLPHAVLLVVGSGTALNDARQKAEEREIAHRIKFIPRQPYEKMMQYTQLADVGLAYDTHPCLNFHLALPNKIFDYFQAGIAVLCGPQPEIQGLVAHYGCGRVMENITPETIAENITYFIENRDELSQMKHQSFQASKLENWDREKHQLAKAITKLSDLASS